MKLLINYTVNDRWVSVLLNSQQRKSSKRHDKTSALLRLLWINKMNEKKHTCHSYAEGDVSAVAENAIRVPGKEERLLQHQWRWGAGRHSKSTAGPAIFCLHVLTHSMIRYVTEIHWDQRTQRAICLQGVGLCDCSVTMSLTLLDWLVSRSTG